MKSIKRTHYCGELTIKDIDKEVILVGWINSKREYKKLAFVDLRDREGLIQIVFNSKIIDLTIIFSSPLESVIWIKGRVAPRKEANPDLKTGEIEIQTFDYGLFNKSEERLPFALHGHIEVAEDLRLQYRYLDLRREEVFLSAIKMRHIVYKNLWDIMDKLGFIHVETPTMIKSTPEGARDYLIPSRTHLGSFYALPQSPQILKQLLMISGIDKYFQIAKCYRDEDLRADRQPEFTQLDIEMSFVSREDVFEVCEKILHKLMKTVKNIAIPIPIKKITYQESMRKYGSDKPDLRWEGEFKTIKYNSKSWKAITCENLEKEEIKELVTSVNIPEDKFLIIQKKAFKGTKGLGKGNNVLLIENTDPNDYCSEVHELFRRELIKKLSITVQNSFAFIWITDFPLFEFSEEENRMVAVHHPFTSPYPDDISKLDSQPLEARANAYDIVLNGYEIGGGSIRIHDQELQRKIFTLLNISEKEQEERFGFLLNAFRYGAPPHGGLAFGLDRLIMILSGHSSLRDVITFPKNKSGECPLTGAPSVVDKDQMSTLGIELKKG
ncbi:MAG: aspartate--tRNA ligase [Candidatus Thorarchaeota archaeon]